MSYCRWSCDDFKSDVYVYECVDGSWTTHVASNRVIGEVPPVPWLSSENVAEYVEASKRRHEYLDTAEHRLIGLPHDGKTFKDGDPEECKATLLMLRTAGYYVPEHAIHGLDEDIAAVGQSGQGKSND